MPFGKRKILFTEKDLKLLRLGKSYDGARVKNAQELSIIVKELDCCHLGVWIWPFATI